VCPKSFDTNGLRQFSQANAVPNEIDTLGHK